MSDRTTRIAHDLRESPATALQLSQRLNMRIMIVHSEIAWLQKIHAVYIKSWDAAGGKWLPVYAHGDHPDAPKPDALTAPPKPAQRPRHIRHSSDGVISAVQGTKEQHTPRLGLFNL